MNKCTLYVLYYMYVNYKLNTRILQMGEIRAKGENVYPSFNTLEGVIT